MNHRINLIWAILPVVPLILGFMALNAIDGPKSELFDAISSSVKSANVANSLMFFNAVLVFVSVSLFHIVACIVVAVAFAWRISLMPLAIKRQSLYVLCGASLLVVFISLSARTDVFGGALNLGYRNICEVLSQANPAPHLLPESCDAGALSRFAWLALLPYISGILAAAFASAYVRACWIRNSTTDVESTADLSFAFNALALVLVTSTMALMLFYKLPLAVVSDPSVRSLITDYGQAMMLFWGIVFTTTLGVIFAPVSLLTQSKASATDSSNHAAPDSFLQHFRHNIAKILTMLAPLLVGSSGTIFETIAAAL